MIERITRKEKKYVIGYHTQEFRVKDEALNRPMKCTSNSAWLGFGYYFWVHIEFAHYWGKDSKKRTGQYDIYKAEIEEENLLNMSFSEEGYFFFVDAVEMVINHFKKNGLKISLVAVQRYLLDNFWPAQGITGIIYDDLPTKIDFPGRTYSPIPPLFYRKRLQIVVFDIKNIINFDIFLEAQNC
jgi:hypothetical protein